MPTLSLKVDCELKPNDEKINKLRALIAEFDQDLVLFETEFTEETMINWDNYMDDFNALSA